MPVDSLFILALTLFSTPAEVPVTRAVRLPAEWQPHAATWLQWPGAFEAQLRPSFAELIRVIQAHEPVHLLVPTRAEQVRAQRFLASRGVPDANLTWHRVAIDNSWMRDNGPVYVTDGLRTWIQDWRFDAWGGNFGPDVAHGDDDRVPAYVADFLGLELEDRGSYVLERGNLESNGAGTLVLGWDCQDQRNPGLSRQRHEAILTEAFGLRRIIWAHGHDPDDGTTGHIDGVARFVDEDTIAVADRGTATERDLVAACEAAGLRVVRSPGDPNWLVGNGFVAAMASGDEATDASLAALLESFFPGRRVYLIDAGPIAEAGGGIHCVTNDQPLGSPPRSR